MTAPIHGVPGTPTFLFTDIEGSTRLIQQLGQAYAGVLDDQRRIVTEAVEAAGGRVFGSEGDALFCSFPTAGAALVAAAEAQRGLAAHAWPDVELRVRMGIHSGEALLADGDYVGLALHEVARITAAGHGGQVLVSEATRRLLGSVPAGLELRDLGERRLKDLAAPERIHQLAGDGLADRFPPLETLDVRPNNLPVQLTSFVGRAELAAARAALAETTLLTLTGPGGTGKTRLALQLAGAVSDEFADGVFFVALDSVSDPKLVGPEIARALSVSVPGAVAPLDAVVEYLRERQTLLVLDNFEQVIDAAPDVGRLLREAPGTKVVVTTRIVLHVHGEREFQVPPLGLPLASERITTAEQAARYEAVMLFVERTRATQPSFTLNDDNAPLVVDIVRRLDGLPLAIELAAARARSLPVAAIHARLDQHLALLTGGARDLPGRQQTLRGAIDWSYELLEGPDRVLFSRFSIHAGGAFLEQAEAVCGPAAELGEDVLDGLSSLADKSLVKADLAAETDPRFAMLVTIRDYAHERLAQSPEHEQLARRHADAYLALVESVAGELTGAQGRLLSDRLEQDHDNLRSALEWALVHGEVEYAMRFIVAVWRFWQTRGHLDEARRQVDGVLAMPGVADQPPELLTRAYEAAGGVTYWQGDVSGTHRYYSLSLEAARRTGDKRLTAQALFNMGFAARDQEAHSGELYAAGRAFWEESLALYRELGDRRGIADATWGLANGLAAAREREAARRYAQEALDAYMELDDQFGMGWGHFILAGLKVDAAPHDEIRLHLGKSIQIFRDARDRSGVLLGIAGYVMLAQRTGDRERMNRLGGAVAALRAETGAALVEIPLDYMEFSLPPRPVDDPVAEEWWDSGTRMTAEEATAYALDESGISEG